MTIEIDEFYRNIKCDLCSKIIERKTKYYYDKPNMVLVSVDFCTECSYRVSLK